MKRYTWILAAVGLALAGCESAVMVDNRPPNRQDSSAQISTTNPSQPPNTIETKNMRVEDHENQ